MFKNFGYRIFSCLNCILIYTDFPPSRYFFDQYYSKNYFQAGGKKRSYSDYAAEEAALRITFRKRARRLRLPAQGQVLDLGCAYGFFLMELPPSWRKFGLEVSRYAAKLAQKNNPDATIKNGTLKLASFPNPKFDLVTLWDVIEHLDQPKKTLELVYRLLKPGGKIALTTGDVDSVFAKLQGSHWHLYNPPQHLSFFSGRTLSGLLETIGYKNIRANHPAANYPLSYLLYKLKNLYRLPLSVPAFAQKIIVPVNLGDIMFIEADK